MESSEHDQLLADMLNRTADLLRGLLQGKTPKIFKRGAKPPRSPRYSDAAVHAVAAAQLLVEQGCFATVQDAEDWAAEQFGLSRDTLRKAAKGSGGAATSLGFPWPDPLEQRIGYLRDRLHRARTEGRVADLLDERSRESRVQVQGGKKLWVSSRKIGRCFSVKIPRPIFHSNCR